MIHNNFRVPSVCFCWLLSLAATQGFSIVCYCGSLSKLWSSPRTYVAHVIYGGSLSCDNHRYFFLTTQEVWVSQQTTDSSSTGPVRDYVCISIKYCWASQFYNEVIVGEWQRLAYVKHFGPLTGTSWIMIDVIQVTLDFSIRFLKAILFKFSNNLPTTTILLAVRNWIVTW